MHRTKVFLVCCIPFLSPVLFGLKGGILWGLNNFAIRVFFVLGWGPLGRGPLPPLVPVALGGASGISRLGSPWPVEESGVTWGGFPWGVACRSFLPGAAAFSFVWGSWGIHKHQVWICFSSHEPRWVFPMPPHICSASVRILHISNLIWLKPPPFSGYVQFPLIQVLRAWGGFSVSSSLLLQVRRPWGLALPGLLPELCLIC